MLEGGRVCEMRSVGWSGCVGVYVGGGGGGGGIDMV